MKVETKKLVSVLEALKPAIAKAQIVEQASHYIFTGNNVVTYNDRLCISYPFSSEYTFSVEGEDLLKTMRTVKETECEIEVTENSIRVKSPTVDAELSTVVGDRAAESMIEGIRLDSLAWSPLPKDFARNLTLCSFSASDDATHRNLTGVHVAGNFMESSDDLRITEVVFDGEVPEVLIPKKACEEIGKYSPVEYCIDESWIHFRNDEGLIFSSRVINETFPNCEAHFDFEGTEVCLPSELKEVAKEISFMCEGKLASEVNIDITICDNECLVEAKKSRGSLKKKLPIVFRSTDPVKMAINPDFLIEAMSKSPVVKVSDDRGRALFSSDTFRHVVSLKGV